MGANAREPVMRLSTFTARYQRARFLCRSTRQQMDVAVHLFDGWLGRASASVTRKHYIDPRIARETTAADLLPPIE